MGTAQAVEPQSQCTSLILYTMFKKKKHNHFPYYFCQETDLSEHLPFLPHWDRAKTKKKKAVEAQTAKTEEAFLQQMQRVCDSRDAAITERDAALLERNAARQDADLQAGLPRLYISISISIYLSMCVCVCVCVCV